MLERRSSTRSVPPALDAMAAWSWRVLLILAVVYVVVQFAVRIGVVVLTLLVGLLLTALLRPAALWIQRHGVPRLAATWIVLIVTIAVAGGVLVLIQQRLTSQLPALRQNLSGGIDRVRDLLVERFGLPPERIDEIRQAIVDQIMTAGGAGVGGAGDGSPVVSGATMLVAVLAALALALFTAFWLVYDGERVGHFLVRLAPKAYESRTAASGRRAWETLGGYLRGTTLVALMDAVGIGLALVVIGVPLPFTLALLTFFGAYIPIVGAVLAGLAAVLVAFAAKGLTAALLVLAAVIVVQQVEGNVLQPMIMGRTVNLHPLAIGYALTIGGVLYGVGGALIAVPLTAVLHAVAVALRDGEEEELPPEQWRERIAARRRRARGTRRREPSHEAG